MTTIAYRDGIMAADTRAFGFDKVPVGEKNKIHRTSDGWLIGVSTAMLGGSKIVREWVEAGKDYKNPPRAADKDKIDFDAIIVKPDGSCILLDGNWIPSDPVKAKFYACGSGKDFALTAMILGQSAADAVKTASKLDAWTGNKVTMLRHV